MRDEGWEPVPVRVAGLAAAAGRTAPAGAPRKVRHLAPAQDPIIGPGPTPEDEPAVRLPRLARHTVVLDDGHQVGVAICGQGIPLVVVHGFSAEGILYAQTLSRLVDLGFKVIAVDTAGHGGTLGLPTNAHSMASYSALLGRVLDHLGVPPAVLVGHSMGGRLVTELAAREPHRAIAVVLLDAIVGDTWDRMVNLFRVFPPLLAGVGATLVVDTMSTVPLFRDPAQAVKLGRLVAPTLAGHLRRPWRMLGPAASILRSRGTKWMLEALRAAHMPVFVVHGQLDIAVPLATAKDAARRSSGDLVIVHRASHSWLLKDPETLPAIMKGLMGGRLGEAVRAHRAEAGLDADETVEQVEATLYEPGALVLDLTPKQRVGGGPGLHRRPRYRWELHPSQVPASGASPA